MSRSFVLRLAVLSCIFFSVATTSKAVILVDKTLSLSGAWASNIFTNDQQIADDVTLSAPGLANELTWYGTFQSSAHFRVRFFNSVAGVPTNTAFYDQSIGLIAGSDTGLKDVQQREVYKFSSPIPNVSLSGSTKYWLSIASTDSADWAWEHAYAALSDNDSFSRYGESAPWESLISLGWHGDSLEKAFRLESVPEPTSLAIVAVLCLAGTSPRVFCSRYPTNPKSLTVAWLKKQAERKTIRRA